jgi:hypothetical protein
LGPAGPRTSFKIGIETAVFHAYDFPPPFTHLFSSLDRSPKSRASFIIQETFGSSGDVGDDSKSVVGGFQRCFVVNGP